MSTYNLIQQTRHIDPMVVNVGPASSPANYSGKDRCWHIDWLSAVPASLTPAQHLTNTESTSVKNYIMLMSYIILGWIRLRYWCNTGAFLDRCSLQKTLNWYVIPWTCRYRLLTMLLQNILRRACSCPVVILTFNLNHHLPALHLTLWLPGRGACQDPDILV